MNAPKSKNASNGLLYALKRSLTFHVYLPGYFVLGVTLITSGKLYPVFFGNTSVVVNNCVLPFHALPGFVPKKFHSGADLPKPLSKPENVRNNCQGIFGYCFCAANATGYIFLINSTLPPVIFGA